MAGWGVGVAADRSAATVQLVTLASSRAGGAFVPASERQLGFGAKCEHSFVDSELGAARHR
jgi:hypothetical protein